MLDAELLTDMVLEALQNPKDKDGKPVRNMPMLEAFCQKYVEQLKASSALNNLVTGTGTPIDSPSNGGAFDGGSSVGGKILLFQPAPISSAMIKAAQSDLGPKPEANIRKQCQAITDFVMASALVNFDSGSITGQCMALKASGSFPGAPGPFLSGEGKNGQITALVPQVLYSKLKVIGGFTVPMPYLLDFCKALVNFTMDNAEVNYASGKITGAFAPNGGPILGGTGIDGAIS